MTSSPADVPPSRHFLGSARTDGAQEVASRQGVVVLGDVMTDVVARVDDPLALGSDTAAQVSTRQGGAGGNVAAWLAALGVRSTLVGRVGDDPFGREAAEVLRLGGVDVRHLGLDASTPTGTCVVLVGADGERTMLPDAGANSALRPEHLPPLSGDIGHHLHVSGYTLLNPGSRDAGLAAMTAAHRAALPVSVDAASAAPLEAVGAQAFLRMTAGAELLVCTMAEAEVLVDTDVPEVAAARLTQGYGHVVLKLGSRGARWIRSSDNATWHVPACPPPGPVVDTTGAGDAFLAALLATLFTHEGPGDVIAVGEREARAALTRACEVAALVTTRVSTRP